MNGFLVRFVGAVAFVLVGCDGVCLPNEPLCGLRFSISGLTSHEAVIVTVRAEGESKSQTFTCTELGGGICATLLDGRPDKISVDVNRNGAITTRTLPVTWTRNGAGSCGGSCEGASVNVAL